MCEYAKYDGDFPMCTVDGNKLCTLCVLGNAHTYKKAKKEEAEKALKGGADK